MGPDAELRRIDLKPKWLLNGFPKAGMHYAVQMLEPLSSPMPDGQFRGRPWVGTYEGNSWMIERIPATQTYYWLGELRPGSYFKGHCGWAHDLEAFMWCLGLAHVFIYRDLRDVAISQAHHILSDREELKHPGRETFRELGGFDAVLRAVLEGLGPYPGLLARWEEYAPWLEVDWVFKFRYEDAHEDPAGVARALVVYGLERMGSIFGLTFQQPQVDGLVGPMVEAATQHRERSPTFRAGRVGDWRACFTGAHKRLFKDLDKNDWLIRLGYERDRDW